MRACSVFAVVAALAVFSSAPASAEKSANERAAELAAEGKASFAEGRYRESLGFYQEAHQLTEWPILLYPIALCWESLNEPERAYVNYRAFAQIPGPKHDAFRRIAREKLAGLWRKLRVPVRVAGPSHGLPVFVDGSPIPSARTPATLRLRDGTHLIQVGEGLGKSASTMLALRVGATYSATLKRSGKISLDEYRWTLPGSDQPGNPDEPPPNLRSLTVRASVDGAIVFLDGVPLGLTPINDRQVTEGLHEVLVHREGYYPWRGRIKLGGAPSFVDVRLQPYICRTSGVTKWALAGGAAASLVGSGVFALLAHQDGAAYDDIPTVSIADRGANRVLYSKALLGLGLVALGGSAYLHWRVGERTSEATVTSLALDEEIGGQP